MAVPKLDQSLWTVTGNARKLAEENQLDPRPTKRESHLPSSQKHAGEFGQILDIHRSILPLYVIELLFICNHLENLKSVSKRPYYKWVC